MPTVVTKIVDPDNGPGTDYTTLQAWANAFGGVAGGNLVTSDKIAVAEIRPSAGGACIEVSLTGWVTDATHYIEIRAAAGYEHRGAWKAGAASIVVTAAANLLFTTQNNVRLTGLQIWKNNAHTGGINLDCKEVGAMDLRIDRCLLRGQNAAWAGYLVQLQTSTGANPTGGAARITNSVLYDSVGTATGVFIIAATCLLTTVSLYNCTFISGAGRAISVAVAWAGQESIRNCLIQAADAFVGETNNDAFNDYNSVSEGADTGGCGSHGRFGQTFGFRDAAIGDFHLALTDGGALGFGVGPAAEAAVPAVDIEGQARVGATCDIGADECGPIIGSDTLQED